MRPLLPLRPTPLVIAHRGASAVAPENTLSAVARAVEMGADMVEVDVQRTRDGALVLMHDATPARTTDVRRRFPRRAARSVGHYSLEQLRRLDAGAWHSAAYAGEVVPTLGEVLDLLDGTGVGLLLELKLPQLHPGVVDDLAVELSGRRGGEGATRMVVQSFDVLAVKELKARMPGLRVGVLGRPSRGHLPVLASWADQVNPGHRTADRGYVEAVRAAGLECLTWTVDREPAQRRVVAHGVDGVITNHPDRLLATLAGLTSDARNRLGVPSPG